jgi:hypothetical protein
MSDAKQIRSEEGRSGLLCHHRSIVFMSALLLLFPLGGLRASESKATPNTSSVGAPWRAQMRAMSEQTLQLINDLLNEPKDESAIKSDKERKARIGRTAGQLAALAKALKDAKELDIGMRPIWAGLVADIQQGSELWKEGHEAYAKTLLIRSTALCAECHTRTSGPSASGRVLPLDIEDPMLRMNAKAALRDFDAAFQEVQVGIQDVSFREARPFEWERFVRAGLQLSVRAHEDPTEALALTDAVLKLKDLPSLFRRDVLAWQKDLRDWLKSSKKASSGVKKSEAQAWKEIRELAKSLEQNRQFVFDRSVDVGALRLSSMAHQFLRNYGKSSRVPDVLDLQGEAYEILRPYALWDISQSYWSACIRAKPHSEVAQRCYRKLESSIIGSWTGSAGVAMPRSVIESLSAIRKLAAPETPAKDVIP